jgi:hypothetical protein
MGAGQSSASVLTVHSLDPQKDVQLLQTIFPDKFRVENVDDSDTLFLMGNDGRFTVLLVASAKPSSVTWVVDTDEILQASKRQGEKVTLNYMNDFTVAEILLSGNASILMVPPGMVASSSGRQALAKMLSSRQNIDLVDQPRGGELLRDVELTPTNSDKEKEEEKAEACAELAQFPSLQVGLLKENGVVQADFPLNSTEPVDVETELFKGKILMILRPPNPEDDPYWNERIFSKRKRRLVIQIQGKFKYKPEGVVYAGAEVSDQMKLGMLVRGLCGMLLKLVESCNSNVHYSFGDGKGEKPHIVAPAYTFFERVLATPPGETPPPMDLFFEESIESISRRKTCKSNGEWNTTDTYSLSFYSMYIDLPTWKLVGLPVSGDISLKTFWGNSLLSICMYEKTGTEKQHLQQFNRYGFAVQVSWWIRLGQVYLELLASQILFLQAKFLGTGLQSQTNEPDHKGEEDDIMRWTGKRALPIELQDESERSASGQGSFPRSESQIFPPAMMMVESDDEFYDAEDKFEDEKSVASVVSSETIGLLALIDSACPAWIDMCTSRGTYGHVYAITQGNKTILRTAQACQDLIEDSEFAQVVDENFSPRMSSSERTRRVLGLMLSKSGQTEKVESFISKESILSDLFLNRQMPLMSDKERFVVQKCGFVARAISDRHWVEEYVKITTRAISFYHPEKRKFHLKVSLRSIVGVERLAPELNPQFRQHYFLVIETSGRPVYLMFGNEKERDSWLDLIPRLKQTRQEDGDSVSSDDSGRSARLVEIGNPAEEYMHKSSLWNCKHRRIMNCRRFSFRCQTSGDALQLVEDALNRALESAKDSFDDFGRRGAFLDSAAALKQANVHSLPEDARLTFFLNLYHVMIMHAFLVLGPPDSSLKWISYFNNIAYQVRKSELPYILPDQSYYKTASFC